MSAKKAKTILSGVTDDYKKSGEIYAVPPRLIHIQPGWNGRKDFSGEEELVNLIKAGEALPPLLVRKSGGELWLVAGERRLRAYLRAIEEGVEIQRVDVIVAKKGTSEVNLYFSHINENAGKPFTPTEEAGTYRRLLAWKCTIQEIAQRTGKSVGHIRNRLELSEAGPELQEALNSGEIRIGEAQSIAKKSEGSLKRQSEALAQTRAKVKSRKCVLTFKDAMPNQGGFNKKPCSTLIDLLTNRAYLDSIKADGFDPNTLKITINPIIGQEMEEDK